MRPLSPSSERLGTPATNARPAAARRFGFAWLALAAALALHVTDEALTDFLSTYNPTVRAIRERLPWLPLPTFTFPVWLAGLVALIVLLFALSPLAFRGGAGSPSLRFRSR